jgi:acyl-CoA reductase-like NAD-dependent aldehyde dehydrogenase
VADFAWWSDGWLGRARCLIGGEWIEPDGERIPVVDPYTEQAIGEVTDAGTELTARAVAAAQAAFEPWMETPVHERAAVLERVGELISERGEALAGLITREMGMPVSLAAASQVAMPSSVLAAFAKAARGFAWVRQGDGAELRHVPLGVVAAITPWNMPVHQIIAKLGAALAAGNTVVLKPSELTPFDALAVAELFTEADLPPGVLNVVPGVGIGTGQALVAHPGVAHVSFTGSVAAGRTVATLAAGHLASATLELGGKSPAVLLDDADFARAVPAAVRSGLVNSGQACNATTRLVAPAGRADEVEGLIADTLRTLALGDPKDAATALGPLVSERQRARVCEFVNDARAQGARVVAGDSADVPPAGFFVAPMVFADVPVSARVLREEVFGPVLTVRYHDGDDEAARIANDSDYGLSAEVWSGDPERAARFGRRLRVGQVKINGVRTRERPAVPFGGFKLSGYGRELGQAGLAEMTTVTAVLS